jgi:SPRY domain
VSNGITSGSKYWSFKILDEATNRRIKIGVSTYYPCPPALNLALGVYPGHPSAPGGCSLNLSDGHFYCNNTNSTAVNYHRVQKATVFGVLLNMDHKTVTFYADGKRVGVGAGSNVLTGQEYFPVIALLELGHCVEVMDLVQPATSHDH